MMTYQTCDGCDNPDCLDCQSFETMEEIVFGAPKLTATIVHIPKLGRWVIVAEKETGRVVSEPVKCCGSYEAHRALFKMRALYGIEGFEGSSDERNLSNLWRG